jgi:hypothetical protein
MAAILSQVKNERPFSYFLTARAVGMVFVAGALPHSHITFGERYPGDGQQAFGFVITFMVIGFVAALVYFAVAKLVHFLFRKKSLRARLCAEAGVFAFFFLTLVYAGVTAHYS